MPTNSIYTLQQRIFCASKLLKLFEAFQKFNLLTSTDIQVHQTLLDLEEEFDLQKTDYGNNHLAYIYQYCKKYPEAEDFAEIIGLYMVSGKIPKLSKESEDLPF